MNTTSSAARMASLPAFDHAPRPTDDQAWGYTMTAGHETFYAKLGRFSGQKLTFDLAQNADCREIQQTLRLDQLRYS